VGVVLFERTRERYDTPAFSLYASPTFGVFGRNDQAAEVKGGTPRFYGTVSATRTAMDDYKDGRGRAVHSSYERWSAHGLAGWTPSSSTRIELSGAVSDGHAAYADRTMDGVLFSRENAGLRVERQNLSRFVQTVEGQLYYNYVDHVMDNYSLRPFTASMMMPAPTVNNPDRRTVGGRTSVGLQLSSRVTATLGVDWQSNRHRIRTTSNQGTIPFESLPRSLDASFDNVGAFGDATLGLGGAARLITGARTDWWTGEDPRQAIAVRVGPASSARPNPTAGLRRHEALGSGFVRYERDLGAATTIYAGLGHSRRAPDYWELVSKESASTLSAFDTRPERTTQLDAGSLFRKGPFSGSASMFVNRVADLILVETNHPKTAISMGGSMSPRATTITRNVDASTWGGEAGLTWSAASLVKVDASVAYVRGENDTDHRPLAQLPPLEGRVGLQLATLRWSLGVLARFVAAQERYALNQGNIVGQDLGPTASFGVISLNGGWRPARFAFLSAGVDNLLDATYAEFVSRGGSDVAGFTTTTRVNEPGRTAWIKLDLRK
jgi:iron complex outermembrane receptor protein